MCVGMCVVYREQGLVASWVECSFSLKLTQKNLNTLKHAAQCGTHIRRGLSVVSAYVTEMAIL